MWKSLTYARLQTVDTHHVGRYAHAPTNIGTKAEDARTARDESCLTACRSPRRVFLVARICCQAPQWVVRLAPHDTLREVTFGQNDCSKLPKHLDKRRILCGWRVGSPDVSKCGVVTPDVELILQCGCNSVKRSQQFAVKTIVLVELASRSQRFVKASFGYTARRVSDLDFPRAFCVLPGVHACPAG